MLVVAAKPVCTYWEFTIYTAGDVIDFNMTSIADHIIAGLYRYLMLLPTWFRITGRRFI